jgi:hypothetical protein
MYLEWIGSIAARIERLEVENRDLEAALEMVGGLAAIALRPRQLDHVPIEPGEVLPVLGEQVGVGGEGSGDVELGG